MIGRILWTTISLPFTLLDLVLTFLFPGDNGWSLRKYERDLIDAAVSNLDTENKAIVRRQLQRLFFVERLLDGRVTHIHFQWRRGTVERMKLPKEYNLAKFKVGASGQKFSVSIGIFDGLIYSLHFSKPPKVAFSHGFEILDAIYGGPYDDTLTQAIDRLEHGKQR